jgi:hypothetical protein
MILNWVDFIDGMQRWEKDVMPRLEQAGLRRPLARANAGPATIA